MFISRLSLPAACLLAGVLASVLAGQARHADEEKEWEWSNILEVYPFHSGDPVRLVKIVKGGKELQFGAYGLPQMAGNEREHEGEPDNVGRVKEWLKDSSFVLKSQTLKTVVSVGISVVFAARDTGVDCPSITGSKAAREPWCDAHPHWCDGGCPELIRTSLHWGLVPGSAASGLEARYRAEARGLFGDRIVLQGKGRLLLVPGEEVTLSPADCVDGAEHGRGSISDPRHGPTDVMNGILFDEGIDEAQDTDPCEERANSKTGCAFAEVPKFNVGLDIVYFDDGTIWGNYGYGYAIPNPDGIFTRVEAHGSPRIASPASSSN